MSTEVVIVLILKVYALLVLLSCGVIWYIGVRDNWKEKKNFSVWYFLAFAIVGLLLAAHFIDVWRP